MHVAQRTEVNRASFLCCFLCHLCQADNSVDAEKQEVHRYEEEEAQKRHPDDEQQNSDSEHHDDDAVVAKNLGATCLDAGHSAAKQRAPIKVVTIDDGDHAVDI